MEFAIYRSHWPTDSSEKEHEALRSVEPHAWQKLPAGPQKIEDMKLVMSFKLRFYGGPVERIDFIREDMLKDNTDQYVAVYQPVEHWREGPWTFLFREIPSTHLVVHWDLRANHELFEGLAFSLAGNLVARFAYLIPPGQMLTGEDLEMHAREGALDACLLRSPNHPIKSYLQDSNYQYQADDTIWSYEAAFAPPRRRLVRKANLAKHRLQTWLAQVRGRKATMKESPQKWV